MTANAPTVTAANAPGAGAKSVAAAGHTGTASVYGAVRREGRWLRQVMLVRKKDTGKLYAMKILAKDMLIKRNQVARTKAESRILRAVRPKNACS